MSGRLPVCEDSAAIAARIAELRRERMAMLAGCTCPQRTTAGEIVHTSLCPLGPHPAPSQMALAWEAIRRAQARVAYDGKMKRRPMPAGASGSMRHAPSQALAEDNRDSARQNQDRPLISEDGQPASGRVGLPRSRP